MVAERSPVDTVAPPWRLLLVDPAPAAPLLAGLTAAGTVVTTCGDGLSALMSFGRTAPQPVLFTREPWCAMGLSASDVVRTLVTHGARPVLVTDDVVGGGDLPAGVDGCVAAPITASTVLAAVASYVGGSTGSADLVVGPLRLDPESLSVWLRGERLPDLPFKEFALLRSLMEHHPGVLRDAVLRQTLWDEAERVPSDNTVAVHVARLRHRLGDAVRIRRLRGRGYLLTLV